MNNIAPIGLTVYGRLEHTKKTIEALKNNFLAKDSHLYIFSDAAKKGDEKIIQQMRNYLKTIDGFKKITIVERKSNSRIKNNRGGQKLLLEKYGKMIWMAEDIVTAPGYLTFMNESLNFYANDKKVYCIGAHTPNLKSNKYNSKQVYFVRRFHPWGFATWQSKFQEFSPLPDYEVIKKNINLIKNLNEYGKDLLKMIKADSEGKINAGDVRACYLMNLKGLYTVLPTQTLVKNIGMDGSGLHCGSIDIHKGDVLSNLSDFNLSEFYYAPSVHKEYKEFYDTL